MLILQLHSHSQPFSFIGELVAHTASRPLMDLLIPFRAHINVLPEISNVANDHGLHTLLIQCGNKSTGLLVFDIFDLVLDFLELRLLRLDELLASTGPFLFPVDLLTQLFLQFVLVLSLGTQISPVEDMGMLSIMRDGHVDLTQVYPHDFTTHRLAF